LRSQNFSRRLATAGSRAARGPSQIGCSRRHEGLGRVFRPREDFRRDVYRFVAAGAALACRSNAVRGQCYNRTCRTKSLLRSRRLSDNELVARIKGLTAREREATAQIVVHLAELDTRDVHLREGYSSLHVYCRDALGLTDSEAFNRIEVARAGRRFPVILEMLLADAAHLTAVRVLAPHLTEENHRSALEAARGKTKAEVELIVAEIAPRPDVAASARRLSGRSDESAAPAVAAAAAPPVMAEPETDAHGTLAVTAAPAAMTAPAPADRTRPVEPLSPGRYKLQLTITGETLEKLRWPRTCSATPSLPGTRPRFSIARSPCSSRISRSGNSPRHDSPDRPMGATAGSRVRAPSPPPSGARSGCETAAGVRSSARPGTGATPAASSNSITSIRTPLVARPVSI
jgi:hypothetical protein